MGLIKIFEEKMNKIFPLILVILSFILIITRTPFFDEANAFLLSQFSLSQLWQITRIEGHPLCWFLILKSVSWLNFYPYPMLFLNWVISSMIILFFWKKAPFSSYIKAIILLSFPFLGYFLIVSRPYGLNVLFLFLLAYFFQKAAEKPLIFSGLLVLCANISIIGTIGSFGFLLLFIKKIIKEKISKKDLTVSCLIILFGFIFLYLQLNHPQIPVGVDDFSNALKNNLFYFFIFPFKDFSSKTILQNVFQTVSFFLFYLSLFVFFKKDKNSFLFLASTFILLSFLFLKVYCGAIWHYFFYLIFFIVSLWFSWEKIKELKFYKYFLILFLILAAIPFSYLDKKGISVLFETKRYIPILNRIVADEELKNSKLYCFEKNSYLAPGLIPYLKKYDIDLYDINGYKRGSFNSYIKTYANNAKAQDNVSNFINSLDKNNYLLINNLAKTDISPLIVIRYEKFEINLKLVDMINDSIFAIYKIEVKENK